MLVYDDPAWFEEMVSTLADCVIGTLSRVLDSGVQFDACGMWEDMCYRAGPLLSPRHFKQYLAPHYRRIADLVRSHGIDVLWVDCDGQHRQAHPALAGGGRQLHVSRRGRRVGRGPGAPIAKSMAGIC